MTNNESEIQVTSKFKPLDFVLAGVILISLGFIWMIGIGAGITALGAGVIVTGIVKAIALNLDCENV